MSLESLTTLRELSVHRDEQPDWDLADWISYKIQAEVDKFYLPRPLYENGEPVQFGSCYGRKGTFMKWPIDEIRLYDDGHFLLAGKGTCCSYEPDERVCCPPEPDTQEKIDDDAALPNFEYCKKFDLHCEEGDFVGMDYKMRMHLLSRQRKLDGVES